MRNSKAHALFTHLFSALNVFFSYCCILRYWLGSLSTILKGTVQLLDTFTTLNEEDKNSATQILKNICQVLDVSEGISKNDDTDATTPTITQTLIQLAKENTLLFFKDQYDIGYAKVKVQQHSEVIALASSKFEYFLSKLYFDYTKGEVAGQESLNNAIRLLVSQTLFDSITVTLNLRVAWGDEVQRSGILLRSGRF